MATLSMPTITLGAISNGKRSVTTQAGFGV